MLIRTCTRAKDRDGMIVKRGVPTSKAACLAFDLCSLISCCFFLFLSKVSGTVGNRSCLHEDKDEEFTKAKDDGGKWEIHCH